MYIVSIRQGRGHWFAGKLNLPVVTFKAAAKHPSLQKARINAKRLKSRAPDYTVSIFRGLSRVETL